MGKKLRHEKYYLLCRTWRAISKLNFQSQCCRLKKQTACFFFFGVDDEPFFFLWLIWQTFLIKIADHQRQYGAMQATGCRNVNKSSENLLKSIESFMRSENICIMTALKIHKHVTFGTRVARKTRISSSPRTPSPLILFHEGDEAYSSDGN